MGVYMLQSSKHLFSNESIDPTCRLCQLDVEDIRHTVTRCPAFHNIRASTLTKLRDIIIEHSDIDVWNTNFSDLDCFLKLIIDPMCIAVLIPELRDNISATVEELSRIFFSDIQDKRLNILKQLE